MKIAVLGARMVGEALGGALVRLGHDVMMGSRTPDNEKALAWAETSGGKAGDFAAAAAHGEVIFNCTKGEGSLAALRQAGAANLAGKVLVDVSNPLAFTDGELSLSVVNTDSLAETIQREFPSARVVKTLNSMNCSVMVDPGRIKGDSAVFLCGNDEAARATARELLVALGWKDIFDLGDLSAARGMEMVLPLWLKLMRSLGTADFNFAIHRRK